jgi:hypothetical protein
MSAKWCTLLVEHFTVYCSRTGVSERSDFDAAYEQAERLRDMYPDASIEISAFLEILE